MKKIVDSNPATEKIDSVIEPLKPEMKPSMGGLPNKPATTKKDNTILIVVIIAIVLVIAIMIYFNMQKSKNGTGTEPTA